MKRQEKKTGRSGTQRGQQAFRRHPAVRQGTGHHRRDEGGHPSGAKREGDRRIADAVGLQHVGQGHGVGRHGRRMQKKKHRQSPRAGASRDVRAGYRFSHRTGSSW